MKKRAVIIRHAAWGDIVQSTAVIPYLVEDGYAVDYITSKPGEEILRHDPRLSRIITYTADSVPIEELDDFYDSQRMDYEKTVVLTGSVEQKFLFNYPSEEYYWTLKKRRDKCNVNYIEEQVRIAGYEPNGHRTKLYFSQEDIAFARNFRNKYKNNFIILAGLSGSSIHKVYAHHRKVMERVLREIPEAILVESGTPNEIPLLSPHGPRVIPLAAMGKSIMSSFALASVADLVIGPETALLNAAGCFPTPKICYLTHSSKKNLTSLWDNDYSLQSATHCSPCHLLFKYRLQHRNVCEHDKYFLHKYNKHYPSCLGEGFPPGLVFDTIMTVYKNHRR